MSLVTIEQRGKFDLNPLGDIRGRVYKDQQVIFFQGDPTGYQDDQNTGRILVIRSGGVTRKVVSKEGQQITLGTVNAPGFIAEGLCADSYHASGYANGKTEIVITNESSLIRLAPQLCLPLVFSAVRRLQEATNLYVDRITRRTPARLAGLIISNLGENGIFSTESTQTDMAQKLCVRRETFNKALAQLTRNGLVDHTITSGTTSYTPLNIEGLQKLANCHDQSHRSKKMQARIIYFPGVFGRGR